MSTMTNRKRLTAGLFVFSGLFIVTIALLTTYRYTVYLPRDAETMDWADSASAEVSSHLETDSKNVSYNYSYWNIAFTIIDDQRRTEAQYDVLVRDIFVRFSNRPGNPLTTVSIKGKSGEQYYSRTVRNLANIWHYYPQGKD